LIRIQQVQAEIDRARGRLLQVQRQIDLHVEKLKGEIGCTCPCQAGKGRPPAHQRPL
jgi:hypothetical protein